jgi:hypothetical protein
MTYEEAVEKMAEGIYLATHRTEPDLKPWSEAMGYWKGKYRSQARAAAEAIGLRETERPRLSDSEIAQVLAGVRRQVEWNGWEEPFVTNRFKSELNALNKKEAQHVAGLK